MLPRPQRLHRPLEMHAIRQRDVNHVDLRIGQQLIVRPIRLFEAVLLCERLCFLGVA